MTNSNPIDKYSALPSLNVFYGLYDSEFKLAVALVELMVLNGILISAPASTPAPSPTPTPTPTPTSNYNTTLSFASTKTPTLAGITGNRPSGTNANVAIAFDGTVTNTGFYDTAYIAVDGTLDVSIVYDTSYEGKTFSYTSAASNKTTFTFPISGNSASNPLNVIN